ncbi:hypothetical protein BU17DRAFT_80971 [Hysterangium stoloniferum]|nr:hypothetical protein BU17DRAFT_80971 [Hysterangium stoloniferum]
MKISAIVITGVSLARGAFSVPAGTPTAAAPQATESLGWGQHWIKSSTGLFLQAAPPWTPGDAVLGPATSAGEFNIVTTSLVDTVHTPNFLYATVAPKTTGAAKLKLSFASGDLTPASGGVFAWSGSSKALTWSRADSTFTGWITCGRVIYANLDPAVPSGCTSVDIASHQSKFAS